MSQQKDLPTWKRVVAGFSLALCIFLTGVIFLIAKQIYISELRGPVTFGFAFISTVAIGIWIVTGILAGLK